MTMEPATSSIKYVDMDVCLSGRVLPYELCQGEITKFYSMGVRGKRDGGTGKTQKVKIGGIAVATFGKLRAAEMKDGPTEHIRMRKLRGGSFTFFNSDFNPLGPLLNMTSLTPTTPTTTRTIATTRTSTTAVTPTAQQPQWLWTRLNQSCGDRSSSFFSLLTQH